jgi:hypothetical protein
VISIGSLYLFEPVSVYKKTITTITTRIVYNKAFIKMD